MSALALKLIRVSDTTTATTTTTTTTTTTMCLKNPERYYILK